VITKIHYVWRIDADIMEGWLVCLRAMARLFWTRVSIICARCERCRCKIKIVPACLIKGTRLTLEALVFTTLAKEISGISWRELCDLLCSDGDGCVFSTLYEAVHRVGKFLDSEKMELFEWARRVSNTAPEPYLLRTEAITEGFGPLSARYDHTISREMSARSLVGGLVADGILYAINFIGLFSAHISLWSQIWSAWSKAIPPLYQRKNLRSVRLTT